MRGNENHEESIIGNSRRGVDHDLIRGVRNRKEENEFEGVVYAVENGKPVASYAKGTLENGKEITLDSPMPLGSVSKQFCAAAIMLLQDQGKLSVSDTLDRIRASSASATPSTNTTPTTPKARSSACTTFYQCVRAFPS